MEYSRFLAQLIGILAVIGGLAAIVSKKHFMKAAKEMTKHIGFLLSIASIELLLGLTIVLKHQVYEGWAMIITIIGWLMVLEAVIYLFAPEIFKKIKNAFLQDQLYYLFSALFLILGAFLLYQGFWA